MANNYLQIDPKDNIIVAITNLQEGTEASIAGKKIILKENINQKHKFGLKDDQEVLDFFKNAWSNNNFVEVTEQVLSNTSFYASKL